VILSLTVKLKDKGHSTAKAILDIGKAFDELKGAMDVWDARANQVDIINALSM
jgi:hypothetical protein